MRIAGGAIAASHDLGIALREHLGLLVGTYLLAARIEGERVSGCGGGGVADDDAAVRGLIGAHALVAVVVLAAALGQAVVPPGLRLVAAQGALPSVGQGEVRHQRGLGRAGRGGHPIARN